MMPIRVLLAFVILLGLTNAAPMPAQTVQPAPNAAAGATEIAPWSLTCYRAGQLAGRAFEKCRAQAAPGVELERDAQGLVGLVTSCKTQAKGVFRLSPRVLAGLPGRAARFDKAVAEALRRCGLPPLAATAGATEALLRASDGLSADWVG